MSKCRLDDVQKELLVTLYKQASRSRDDLPYTEDFEQLYVKFVHASGLPMTRHEVWKALASAGKASRLERKVR